VPGTDDDLLALSSAFDAPARPPGILSHSTVTRSLDRRTVAAAADRAEIGPPETILCGDLDTLGPALGVLGLPVMVKPVDVVVQSVAGFVRRAAVRVVDAAAARVAAAALGWPVELQAVLPGPVWSLAGVAVAGELLAYATSRYVRIWPPAAGSASASVTVATPDGLADAARAMVTELGVDGLFELELVEASEGRLATIDFNPRPHGSLELAIRAGADLPAIWLDWLVHARRPSETIVARSGIHYRWEDAELRNAWHSLRTGEPRRFLQIARPRRNTAHAVVAVRDPGPAFARILMAARSLPARLSH
jgi:predicted ATP-grasp superfamily ATP-dependent carboligase